MELSCTKCGAPVKGFGKTGLCRPCTRKGTKMSEEAKKNMSLAAIKRDLRGERNPAWKGGLPTCLHCDKVLWGRQQKTCRQHRMGPNYKRKERVLKATAHYSLKGIINLSNAKKGLPPEQHSNWKGGISKLRDYGAVMSTNRRAMMRGCVGKYTITEWEDLKTTYGHTCPCCNRQEPEITLTADHIIPVSLSGPNTIDNIQPLCLSCNSSKRTKIIKYEPCLN